MSEIIQIGQRFDAWEIISDTPVIRGTNKYILCKCTICNDTERYIRLYGLSNLSSKKCSACHRNLLSKPGTNAYENAYFSKVKSRAKKKKIPFTISIEEMFRKLEVQNFKCALTGLDINFYNRAGTITASLDRKDSSKGYLKNNIQWVLKDINTMKNVFSEEYFLSLCHKVLTHKKIDNVNTRLL